MLSIEISTKKDKKIEDLFLVSAVWKELLGKLTYSAGCARFI